MEADRHLTPLRHTLVFIAFAAVLAIYVLAEPRTHGSFWIDYVWAKQFAAQLANGDPYPRWLNDSFGGLGAPVFYFYAPLTYYLIAAFSAAGTWPAILLAFIVLHAASGFAMHHWLGGGRSRPALTGALIYMALPYHLIDFGRRGAIAEFGVYVFVPLVALGLRRAVEGRSFVMLALAYAGLILTHLPLALLVSLFFIPTLFLHLGRGKGLVSVAASLVLGLGLASTYWLPALLLQDHINPILWGRHFSPPYWRLTNLLHWEEKRETWLIAAAILGSAGAAALLIWQRRLAFWPIFTIALCLVAGNMVPALWSIPILAKVQFPWRTMVLVDFALVTAAFEAVRAGLDGRRLLMAFAPLALLSVAVMALPLPTGPQSHQGLDQSMPDVPEYRWDNVPDNGRAIIAKDARVPLMTGQALSLLSIFVLAYLVSRQRAHARRLPSTEP